MSGSNSTSTPPNLETPVPTPTPSPSTTANTSQPPPVTTTEPTTPPVVITPTTQSTTSTTIPPVTTSSTLPPTTTTTSSSTVPPTPSTSTTSSAPPSVITSIITQTPTVSGQEPSTIVITSTRTPTQDPSSRSLTSSRTSSTAALNSQTAGAATGGLNGGGKIAVAVVVPIVAVALLILGGIFLWRKRKQRKDAEELRRKEVEEYGYNPNNDPSLPTVGAGGVTSSDGPYEMREDGSSGYRGWGTTAVASSGGKASTTMSGPSAGGIGVAYSEPSPSHDARSDNPLVDGRSMSPEPETLGAMGPAASQNRNGDIHRGPSNASSSYSAANRSDNSGDAGYGGTYNNQYDSGNPYTETAYGSPPNRAEMSGQPVIRDVSARRNTRIENPSHFPQQSAGISQNF